MNNCIITGNLVKDAELKIIGDKGTPKLSFTVANNQGFGDNKKVVYVNCVLWGKGAAGIVDYMTKGQKVLVKGSLDIRQYDDKEGNKKYLTEIVCDMFGGVEFIGKAQGKSDTASNNQDSYIGEVDDSSDNLPF